jgi:cytochrome c oxidase subunit 2
MRLRSNYLLMMAVLYCLGATQIFAADELPVAADELVYCSTCHGIQLMGNPIIKAPRLSGMETWYIERQLHLFRKGWRGGHAGDAVGMEMQPMAAALSDEQISEAAEYVAATRSPMAPRTISGDLENGKLLYGTCSACHGASGEGNLALGSPRLTIVNDWYLVTQLKNFKSGDRGSHAGDTYGMQMRASAQLLADDAAIMDVVSYISTLKDK